MEVERIAVIGAGTMGAGIAQSAAVGGFEVALREVEEERLSAARQEIDRRLDRTSVLDASVVPREAENDDAPAVA